MLDKVKFLKSLVNDLQDNNILFNIDMGINFNIFIVSKDGDFLVPIKSKYCSAEEQNILETRCQQSCLNHLELAVGMKDVIKAKCYAGFDNLIIPIFIDNDFVGIVGGCIPKKKLKDIAIEKTIYLFKGISGIFEELGNKEYRIAQVVDELTELSEDILMNYDISSGVNVFFDLDEVFRTILVRSIKITDSRDGWMLIRLGKDTIRRITLTSSDDLPMNNSLAKSMKSVIDVVEIDDPKNHLLKFLDLKKVLAAPIFHTEGHLGVILLVPREEDSHYSLEMKKYVEILCNQTSLAYKNSRIFRQIEDNALELVEYIIKDFFEYSTNVRLIEKVRSNINITDLIKDILEEMEFENAEFCFLIRDFDQDRIKQYHLLLKSGKTKFEEKELIGLDELKKPQVLFKNPRQIFKTILNDNEDVICIINSDNISDASRGKVVKFKKMFYYIMYSDLILNLIKRDFMGYIFTLMKSFNFRDPYKVGAYEEVAELSTLVAKKLGIKGDDLIHLRLAALFEDIGLVHISEDILNKREKLTKEEFNRIKKHTVLGASILESVPILERTAHIVEACHENFDGSGYPKQLKHGDIPLLSRIIFLVSSYVSMHTNRAYRYAMTEDEIIDILKENSGKKYDPQVVEAFLKIKKKKNHFI